jgi:hypothetical protein
MAFKFPKLRDIVIGFIAAFFGFQILSLIVSSIFPDIPLFKGGAAILIMLLGIAIISLFILGIRYDELKSRENLIFVILVFGLTIAGYYFLPTYFPQLFSISPDISFTIKQTVGSIIGVGG